MIDSDKASLSNDDDAMVRGEGLLRLRFRTVSASERRTFVGRKVLKQLQTYFWIHHHPHDRILLLFYCQDIKSFGQTCLTWIER